MKTPPICANKLLDSTLEKRTENCSNSMTNSEVQQYTEQVHVSFDELS